MKHNDILGFLQELNEVFLHQMSCNSQNIDLYHNLVHDQENPRVIVQY